MKKEVLKTFIKRYSLGKLLPKVKWKYSATEKTLHTRATADNKTFIADVIMTNFSDFGTDDIFICIGDTEKVNAMLSPFGEAVTLTINKTGDRLLGFSITDADCESYCTAADPSIIDPVPKTLQEIQDYDVVIPLTDDLLEKFLKARTALSDVPNFSVGMNKKGALEIIIGYTTANSNRIRILPQTDPIKNKLETALSIPLKNIAEVFKANSDILNGTMSIHSTGLIRIYFKNDDYTCTYFQFANKRAS